jgi:hypothetical protein
MDLGEKGWGSVEWIQMAQDRDRWRAVVSVVMNLRVIAPRVSRYFVYCTVNTTETTDTNVPFLAGESSAATLQTSQAMSLQGHTQEISEYINTVVVPCPFSGCS